MGAATNDGTTAKGNGTIVSRPGRPIDPSVGGRSVGTIIADWNVCVSYSLRND